MNRKKKSGEVLGKVSDNVPSKIYIVLMAVFALVFIGAALGLFHSIHGYREGDNFYQELYQDKTEIAQSGSEMPTVDFQALQAVNSDVTAWLYQAGTGINYPVVQGRDNDYYLNHLLNGDKNKYGTPFIDYRTIDVFHTSMTIIYGHNMKNGAIFASLTEYKSQSYYDAHPTMTLLTPNGNYTLEIFSGFVTDGNSDFYQREFSGDEDFLQYVANVTANSDFQSSVTVDATDAIVMLSTCAYDFDEARYILFARLTPMVQ